MPGTLILCATPIGNLADASPRLAQTLAESDVIYCEDTRRSRVLLESLGVKKRLRSYFAGNERVKQSQLAADLESDLTVALLTDAGIPAISDPGWSAVNAARRAGARVTVVPGPSALTASLAVSGFPSERVVFEGFLPRRGRARQERLNEIALETRTTVLFVGAAHVLQDLEDLAKLDPGRPLCVARELTKKFEEILWMTCAEALAVFGEREAKGELTLVLSAVAKQTPDIETGIHGVLEAMARGQPMTTAVRLVAADLGLPRRKLYEMMLARTRDTTTER